MQQGNGEETNNQRKKGASTRAFSLPIAAFVRQGWKCAYAFDRNKSSSENQCVWA